MDEEKQYWEETIRLEDWEREQQDMGEDSSTTMLLTAVLGGHNSTKCGQEQ